MEGLNKEPSVSISSGEGPPSHLEEAELFVDSFWMNRENLSPRLKDRLGRIIYAFGMS